MSAHILKLAAVDETGTTKDPNQPIFGVGAFAIHGRHLALNQSLRNVFLEAVEDLRIVEERFEFKFTYITPRSMRFYKKLLQVLETFSAEWSFSYAIAHQPRGRLWELYLDLLERLFVNEKDKFIVLADHLNKPKRAERGLSDVVKTTPSVAMVVQLESQGSVLLQVTDVLLGALVYLRRQGEDVYKKEIADMVAILLLQKEGAGIDPIYATPNSSDDTRST